MATLDQWSVFLLQLHKQLSWSQWSWSHFGIPFGKTAPCSGQNKWKDNNTLSFFISFSSCLLRYCALHPSGKLHLLPHHAASAATPPVAISPLRLGADLTSWHSGAMGVGWSRVNPVFWLHPTQTSVRAGFKGLHQWSCFILARLAENGSKRLMKPVEKPCQMGPQNCWISRDHLLSVRPVLFLGSNRFSLFLV